MTKFAKIINIETKECSIGLGTNAEFYQKIGMTEMEVEQAYDGKWYIAGYAPAAREQKEARRRADIIAQLDALDLKCIRALRAISAGTGTEADTARLAELEAEAEELREQL